MTNDDLNKKRKIQRHMMELTEEIDKLNDEEMTLDRFWGKAAMDFEEATFDYGRDSKKEENYDEVIKKKYLPYRVFHLFE